MSTTWGTTVAPLATEAATVAMASGETSTLPWPIIDAACSVPVASGGTDPTNAGRPRSKASPMPRAAAALARSAWETVVWAAMNAVLHELATAVRNETRPVRSAG